ncbi:hypothetical protein CDAR_478991 [Caerostris darwini]|uniref:Uncharacterized protein n=1 Tax=Caerostris darwini TaxID=1538125 RepID=A0AAV4RN38_9ARAC|nr:hypothetical protein CDAR_478991 [Caerostris darwini]
MVPGSSVNASLFTSFKGIRIRIREPGKNGSSSYWSVRGFFFLSAKAASSFSKTSSSSHEEIEYLEYHVNDFAFLLPTVFVIEFLCMCRDDNPVKVYS